MMGLPGKSDGMAGSRKIAEYCESDVVNTYCVWLQYERFRGRLSEAEYQSNEAGSRIECFPRPSQPWSRALEAYHLDGAVTGSDALGARATRSQSPGAVVPAAAIHVPSRIGGSSAWHGRRKAV